ncbi:MAG: LysM peptidoglycan-binding domain-containing protein [Candidatus Omnitrophota bacterium]|jgi:nucleoid-associated protein YgaU|nr:MAG: LysM peptidoglycan-binding domain-containing protein [Candidatus Omnitrophota bacterium]
MDKKLSGTILLASVFIISGCVVRTYPLTKDRVDQDLSAGNRGYLKGEAPYEETKVRKTERTTRVVEIELGFPAKAKKGGKAAQTPVTMEEAAVDYTEGESMPVQETAEALNYEEYVVQKNDTLQKISQKFYGTTKKWNKIFEANKEALKSPDRIYPGQTIMVPVENMKEPAVKIK